MAVSADSAGQVKRNAPGRVRQRNRAKILQAAEHVFAERGYDGATTAAIADRAGLPKANVHYYFGTKSALYRAVIDSIIELWLEAFGDISEDSDPAETLGHYIRAKLAHSRERPLASRIFANEIIRGAPILSDYLKTDLRDWVTDKSRVLKQWADAGKMDPVDPAHLFFMIWSTTQTYADFDVQMRAVLGRQRLTDEDFETAAATITDVILKGCGIAR